MQRNRTVLRLEALEDRVVPVTDFIVSFNASGSILTLTKDVAGNGQLQITSAGQPSGTSPSTFGQFIITTSSGTLTTPIGIVTAYQTPTIAGLKIVLNGGQDNLTIDGQAANYPVNLPSGLTITGSGGNKTILVRTVNLVGSTSNLSMTLNGSGFENTTFTDCNIGGTATITHGSGPTQLTINTDGNNQYPLSPQNNWNSLSVTNGSGSDINTIQDTNFAGNVTINNGAGAGTTGQFAGSKTVFQDQPGSTGMYTVGGNLTITTGSGQSDTEVYDYNVHGALTVNAGAGISGQGAASFVGVSNAQSNSGTIPTFGSVSVSGTAVKSAGLIVDIGTGLGGGDFPATIGNGITLNTPTGITLNATGSGQVTVNLNDLFVTGASTLTLGSSTTNDNVTVRGNQALSTFGPLTFNAKGVGNGNYNFQSTPGSLNVIGALQLNLGSGTDNVNFGSSTSHITVTGALGVSSTGGSKTISVIGGTNAAESLNATLGGVKFSLAGGQENTTFIDTNVSGAATIAHSGSGDTNFTIDTSTNNVNELNNWNSLSITNGTGTDTNSIFDTIFAGNVTISNGAGHSGVTTLNGGSQTLFHAHNYKVALLNILGNLSISTSSGQSDSEIYDYNVLGSATISTGSGISQMLNPNLVGIEDHQTSGLPGNPVFGAVTINGTTVSSSNTLLTILMGTDNGGGDFPLTLNNNLTVNVNGSGGSNILLQDVVAQYGTTSFTFGGSTGTHGGNTLKVFGTSITSIFNIFNITSSAALGSNNTFDLQDQKGTLQIAGTMKWALGQANTLMNFASDPINNNGGVPGAELDLYAFSANPITTPAIKITDTNPFGLGVALDLVYGFKNGTGLTLFYYGIAFPLQAPVFSPNITLA
jgi:hypothetical protein